MKDHMVKRVEAVLLAAVCTVGLAACSSQTTAASATAAQPASQQGADNQATVYGKVTAVDGSKITLALGTLNRGEGGRQESGKGGGQGGASGSEQKGDPPSKDNTASGGDNSEGKNQRQPGSGGEGGFEMLTLTGETKTITISDESILTRQSMRGNRQTPDGKTEQGTGSTASSAGDTSNTYSTKGVKNTNGNDSGESASLSDITVGSVLKVTSETGTDQLVSVQILGGGTREKPEESSSSSQS